MNRPKIVLIDGVTTAGKSTTSYNLARKLPGWIFIDIWRIKDIFESIGYSKGLEKKEKDFLMALSKKATMMITREVIRNTQRNIILQEAKTGLIKKKLRKDLKKHNYKIYTVQLIVPLKEAVKRSVKRKKPGSDLGKAWSEERWNKKIKRKTKKGDIVIDTLKNSPEKVVEIILKNIGEKAKKHPYTDKVRKYW